MPSILIVDDEHDVLTAFAAVLRHERYTVRTATTGQLALELFDKFQPDLVLLDIKLGDLEYDGLYLLRRMRERRPTVKIIIVSAYLDEVTRSVAIAAGALECWSKPVTMQMLRDRTAAVIAALKTSPIHPPPSDP